MTMAKMTEPLLGVYGSGGSGRGVMPLARARLSEWGVSRERLVFIDDSAKDCNDINGHRVVTRSEFLKIPASSYRAVIAIANSKVRERISVLMHDDGIEPWSVIAENVVLMDEVQLGVGAILSPFVTITSNIRIGRHFHANLYSYVEHDCVVGDYVTLAPGARVNGNIVVEDHVYIGSGAVIKQGQPGAPLVIGRGAVVGMGAVVTKSVSPGETVVGNPARLYQKPVCT